MAHNEDIFAIEAMIFFRGRIKPMAKCIVKCDCIIIFI